MDVKNKTLKNKHNILILSWRDPKHPNNGGAEQVTHEHAKAWVRNGYSVTLFCSTYPNAKSEEYLDGVKIIRRGHEHVIVQFAAFFWYLKHKKDFDIVFDHFHGIPFFTPLFVRVKKTAFIHEVAREVWKLNALPKNISWLPALVGPIIEPLIFKLFYRNIPFITVSDSTKKDLINLGIAERRITVIYNGLNIPENSAKYSKEKVRTVLFLGALALDKGIYDAIRVFAELSKYHGNWQFWVVGRGGQSQVDELRVYANSLNINDKNLKFWGYVSENKKYELLSRAHILINPSAHEGWGLVNMEASAMGTPIVAYDVHGNRDSVKNNVTGKLVPRGDKAKMAESVYILLNNNKIYEEMRRKGLLWSKGFSWDKAQKESLTYINNIF